MNSAVVFFLNAEGANVASQQFGLSLLTTCTVTFAALSSGSVPGAR